jgi:hypothetical protein
MSLEQGNGAVSESQVKADLNGTTSLNGANGFALPGVFGALADQGVAGCEHVARKFQQTG